MRIVTAEEMRTLDRVAETEYLVDSLLLMENAGRAAVQMLFDQYPQAGRDTEVLVFAGKGNNAGDAFVVARRLLCLSRRVRIFLLTDPASYKGSTKKNYETLLTFKPKMMQLETGADLDAFFERSQGPFTVVDGILGTGLKGPLDGIYYDVVQTLNRVKARHVLALDIPTGVNGDTGAVETDALYASLTVSFGFPKLGHFLPPGAARRGELLNVDISLPPDFRSRGDKFLLMKNPMADLLKERDRYGHKNSFGHTLLIGGSPGKTGAISMAARACQRMGTGLVTMSTWTDSLETLLHKIPLETMALPIALDEGALEKYRKWADRYTSVIVGPGLGLRAEGRELMDNLLSIYQGPMVVDADGLNLIAQHEMFDYLAKRSAPTVLTPHPGEMARLLGIPKEEIVRAPIEAVRKLVEKTRAVVVLKGAATVIGSIEEKLYINHYPNDGMATAGTGDVLAGMIGGLLGQGITPFHAAQLGVYLHSLAGGFAAGEKGHRSMTAPDIIENISNAFKDIKAEREPSFPEEGRARLL